MPLSERSTIEHAGAWLRGLAAVAHACSLHDADRRDSDDEKSIDSRCREASNFWMSHEDVLTDATELVHARRVQGDEPLNWEFAGTCEALVVLSFAQQINIGGGKDAACCRSKF